MGANPANSKRENINLDQFQLKTKKKKNRSKIKKAGKSSTLKKFVLGKQRERMNLIYALNLEYLYLENLFIIITIQ